MTAESWFSPQDAIANGFADGMLFNDGVDAASAATISFDDVIELIHNVLPQYRPSSQFLTSDTAVKMLRKVKDTSGQYIWSPSLIPGQPDKIYGYPVNISSSFKAPETGKAAMVFGDFKGYWIGDRLRPTLMRTAERYFEYDQVAFRIEIAEKCLKEGGEIVYREVRKRLIAVIGSSGRSTGELVNSLGVTPVKRDKHGVYNVKIGFNEPRKKQSARTGKRSYYVQTNAMIANVLEHGRSNRGTQPARPFMKPAVEQSERQVYETMQRIFDSEVDKL